MAERKVFQQHQTAPKRIRLLFPRNKRLKYLLYISQVSLVKTGMRVPLAGSCNLNTMRFVDVNSRALRATIERLIDQCSDYS